MVWDDCDGATRDDAWSSPVTVHVSGNITPSVQISASKTKVSPGESVTFTAKGSAEEIKSLDIVVDGVTRKRQNCYLGSSCSVSYTTSFQSGEHTAYAVMSYVENGETLAKTSDPVTVTVETTPPPVSISYRVEPSTTVHVGDPVTLTASASSDAGIQHIVFYVDGKGIYVDHCDGSTSCSVSHTVSFDSAGDHTTHIRVYYGPNAAYYKDSGTITIHVLQKQTNQPPVVYKVDGYSVTYTDVPYTVTVCARDSDGKVVKIEAWMDNREHRSVTVDSSDVCKKITLYAPLTAGRHTVYARAEDDDGAWSSTASKTFTAIRRNVPPTAVVIPAQTTVIPGATFSYRVCGKDSDGKIVQVAGKVGDESWQYDVPDSNGCAYFQYRAPSRETDLTIYGKAKDNDGAWSKIATAVVHVRYSAPVFSAFVPPQIEVGKRVPVRVTMYDADGDLNAVELNVYNSMGDLVDHDSSLVSGSRATATLYFSVDAPGEYRVVIRVSDTHGKSLTKTYRTEAVKRNVPPTATISAPAKVSPGKTFDFKVCGKDSDGRVVQIAARVGSSDWQYKNPDSAGCAEFVATAPAIPTTLTVYGKVKDDDGAWSSEVSAKVVVAYSAPAIVAFNVPPEVYVGREFKVTVSARDVDNDLGRAELVIEQNGTVVGRWSKDLPSVGGTVTFDVSVSEAGEHTATVTVYDIHGLSTAESRKFTAVLPPNKPPVVDSVRILGTVYVDAPFEMNVCAHDPDGVVSGIVYAIAGGAQGYQAVNGNGCHVIRVQSPGDGISPGAHKLNVVAIDDRGARSAPYTTTIYVHNREHPPEIVSYSFPPSVEVSRTYDIDVTAADRDGDLSRAELNVYSASGSLVSETAAPLSGYRATAVLHLRVAKPGSYVAVIAVYDSKGASDSRKLSFRASDSTPPVVRVTAVRDVNVPGNILVSFAASDNVALRDANVYVRGPGYSDWHFVEHMPLSGASATATAKIPVRIPGEYNIMVAVSDTSGNTARTYALGKAVDQIPPVVMISAPSDANLGQPYHFSVTVTDNYLVKSVVVSVDGNTIYRDSNVDKNYWSREFTYYFPHASPHKITVTASDSFGNVRTESHPVEVHVVDTNAPTIDLNAWYDADVPAVEWHAVVSDPNLSDVNVYVTGTYFGACPVSAGVAECAGKYDVNTPGTYVVEVVAADSYHNVAKRSVSVSVVDQPPVVDISAPSSVAAGTYATIFVSAHDDFGLAHVDVNGYGLSYSEPVSGRAFEHEFNVFLPSEGNYVYTVWVSDTNGHVVEKNTTIVATKEGHSYELILSKENGAPARVWAEGEIDGKYVDLACSDAVIHVIRTDDTTALAQYELKTVDKNGHKACEVDITGAGYYTVTVTWQGVQKSISVHAFKGVSSAPENPVVAVGVALVLLALAARFI